MRYDVIVIGAGLAGVMAAETAQATGASVLLVSKGGIGMGTNSAISNAVFAGPGERYPLEKYVSDTITIGKGINHEQMVIQAGRNVREAIDSLRSHGIEISERPRSFTVQPQRSDQIRGVCMMKSLASTLKGKEGITPLVNFYVTEILRKDTEVFGIKGFDASANEFCCYAPAVVLAAGGGGGLYLHNDNQKSTMGQGYALAAKTGLDLWDMEFVQFYPFVLAEPRLPRFMVYPPYPKEASVVNASGEDILKKHGFENLNHAIRKMRDAISAMIETEGAPGPVYMDYRSVPENRWGQYPASLFRKLKFDFKKHPFRIAPGVHYFMGGVRVDESAQTDINGLFACGEMLWGLHGANRRGGNALTECVVFGRIAGRSAARYAKQKNMPAGLKFEKKISYRGSHRVNLRELRHSIREIAGNHAGIRRNAHGIKAGLSKLADLQPQLQQAKVESIAEIKLRFDLLSASLVLKAILTASLGRQESRGSFCRDDYPNTDDVNWKQNSCLRYNPDSDSFDLVHRPVPEPAGGL
ncbi:MAG: FAD-binding protein [Deltaproteobacteria bacterium]|nr:FAD-binding protein [Deltaproteobacteria bacterium]